jgi:hypothetical protein
LQKLRARTIHARAGSAYFSQRSAESFVFFAGPLVAPDRGMLPNPDYIAFISDYCDRWCERCPLTHRCAAFAGRNHPEARSIDHHVEQLDRVECGREKRVDAARVMIKAREYGIDAYTWLELYEERTRSSAALARAALGDSVEGAALRNEIDMMLDALDVVDWDSALIPVKLDRALAARQEGDVPLPIDGDAFQTEGNGLAKLTLLLVERSEAAWRLIATWAPETVIAVQIAGTLASLRLDIERLFPNARRFIRPGFDDASA